MDRISHPVFMCVYMEEPDKAFLQIEDDIYQLDLMWPKNETYVISGDPIPAQEYFKGACEGEAESS